MTALRCLCIAVLLSMPVVRAVSADGAEIYRRCAACHLPDGKGVPGAFPPLSTQIATFAESDSGREYLVLVLAAGLSGEIRVANVAYRGVMPAQSGLHDADRAAVLNYVLANSAKAPLITRRFEASEVAQVQSRYPKATAQDVHRMRPSIAAVSGTSAIAPTPRLAGVADGRRARQNWTLNCQGCHRADASGSQGTTPPMAGAVARFLAVAGGREYLVRVPGVAAAPLSDAQVAELLNWLLWTYDAGNIPRDFTPYSADEVHGLRRSPLRAEASRVRNDFLAQLSGGSQPP